MILEHSMYTSGRRAYELGVEAQPQLEYQVRHDTVISPTPPGPTCRNTASREPPSCCIASTSVWILSR